MHNIDLYPDKPLGLPRLAWLVVFTYLATEHADGPLVRQWDNVTVHAAGALTALDVRRIETSTEQYHNALSGSAVVTNIVALGVEL